MLKCISYFVSTSFHGYEYKVEIKFNALFFAEGRSYKDWGYSSVSSVVSCLKWAVPAFLYFLDNLIIFYVITYLQPVSECCLHLLQLKLIASELSQKIFIWATFIYISNTASAMFYRLWQYCFPMSSFLPQPFFSG